MNLKKDTLVVQLTVAEFEKIVDQVVERKLKEKNTKELSPFCDSEERSKIFSGLSSSRIRQIMKWGKDNGYAVRKSGNRAWNRTDLIQLRNAFALTSGRLC